MYGTFTTHVPGTYVQGAISTATVSESRSMTRTGTTTSGYMASRKKGRTKALPENGFSFLLEKKTYPHGWVKQSGLPMIGSLTMGINGCSVPIKETYLPSSSEITSLNNRAITKLRGKLKDQSVNLVQAFAERKQTVNLVAETASTMLKMFRAVRHGDLGSAADVLGVTVSKRARKRHRRVHQQYINKNLDKVMANGVLQLNFGWKPLLSDIYGSAEMLANKQFREVWNQERASSKIQIDDGTYVTTSANVLNSFDKYKLKYEVNYLCRFAVSNDITHTMSQVGITNPALIVWELLPWSFVIDWFLPIGNYISSLDATVGLQFVGGCKTTFYRLDVGRHIKQPGQKYVNGAYTTCDARAGLMVASTVRTKLSSFPAASLPSFKNPFSFTHAADAISLLTQFRKKP